MMCIWLKYDLVYCSWLIVIVYHSFIYRMIVINSIWFIINLGLIYLITGEGKDGGLLLPFYWKRMKKLVICLLFIMVFPSKIFSVMFWSNCVFTKIWYGSTDMMKKFCEIMLHTNESQNEFGNQMSFRQKINFYFVVFQNSSDVSEKIWDTATLFFFIT